MKKWRIFLILLIAAAALIGFVSCDLLFGPIDDGDSGSSDTNSLAVDVKPSYFTDLSISSVDVYVNDTKVGTINSSLLGSSYEYSQFSFNYSGTLSSVKFISASYSDTFDSISDFASSPPASITSMSQIDKVVLYPKGSWPYGTGAYVGPKKPYFTTSGVTTTSVELNVSEYESPIGLTFNIYISTNGGTTYLKHNSTPISGTTIYDGYTVTGLEYSTDYDIKIEAIYDEVTSVLSTSKSFTTEDPPKWTIMVWLDGDNNLNSAAVTDFHEMEYGLYLAQLGDADITDKLNIIVQYDQNEDYDSSSSTPGRYKVLPRNWAADATLDPDDYYTVAPGTYSSLIQSISEPNMGSAAELGNFIAYTKANYPAENYGLILWNHGGGVRELKDDNDALTKAICWDDTDDEDALYIGEIKDYLDSSDSVDFLGMDACLMGFLEVAYEFRPGTGDFGAQAISFSPATEQGDGWEYEEILSRLTGAAGTDGNGHIYYDIDTLTAQQLATVVAQEYGDAWSSVSWETQTAVDLTKVAAVNSALGTFASEMAPYKAQVEGVRGEVGSGNLTAYFDESDVDEWYKYAGFDLYELAEQVKAISSVTSLNTAADNLMSAVDNAVLYSFAHSSSYTSYGTGYESGKNGLAIFFPDGDVNYDPNSDGGNRYWAFQHWYNGVSRTAYNTWWSGTAPEYGGLDFCTSDGDGTVESWFELLQYWYNPASSTPNNYNPGNLE